jgi:hypothetical protein
VNGWLDAALDGHYGAKSSPRDGHKPIFLVLHGTAGGTSAVAIDNYFASPGVEASSHFIIDQQGVIIQGVSCDTAAWANCCLSAGHASYLNPAINQNLYTISIEHVKSSTDNSDALTAIQAQRSFELIDCICDAYAIPKRAGDARGGIISHADIDPINRSRCPGAYPWDGLWASLNGGAVKNYHPGQGDFDNWFVANSNGTWTCKSTKAVLMGGNLALYQTLSIDGNTLPVIGLPLESEQYHKEADGYSWSTQKCERAEIMYDPEHRKGSQPGFGSSFLAHVKY